MMRNETRLAGKSWWCRFNDWQAERWTQSMVDADDRIEWNKRLRMRGHDWIWMTWFALAWVLALCLPRSSNTVERVAVVVLVSLPLLLLAVSRFRVLRELDEMMRRAELQALAAAGAFAAVVIIAQALFEVLHLPWPVQPKYALMVFGLVYAFALRRARSHYR